MAIALLDDFDIDTTLLPIAGENPCGADPREDVSPTSVYFRLRDARAEAREAERQSETGGEESGPPPSWRTVRSLAEKALRETAKDLEIATWLTEALVRAAGLRGLATGAAVIAGMVERFWDGLYPTPDEDGIETRVGPLAGLSGQGVDGSLMQPLRKLPLFRRPGGAPFGYWQYELSVELSGITDPVRRQQRLDSGVVAFDDVENEARLAGPAHWTAIAAELSGALEAWTAMATILDERAGEASPSTSRVRDLLLAMADTARRFAPADAAAPAVAGGTAAAPAAALAAPGLALLPLSPGAAGMGREEALRQLGEIAAWFKRNEPNSPLAYTLDEAVRRGRMSWPDLVAELLPDTSARNSLLVSLGIRPPPEPTE